MSTDLSRFGIDPTLAAELERVERAFGRAAAQAVLVASDDRVRAAVIRAVGPAIPNRYNDPYGAAVAVMQAVADWDPKEFGISANDYVRLQTNQSVTYFKNRARAVEILGESIKDWLPEELAVWLTNQADLHPQMPALLARLRVRLGATSKPYDSPNNESLRREKAAIRADFAALSK